MFQWGVYAPSPQLDPLMQATPAWTFEMLNDFNKHNDQLSYSLDSSPGLVHYLHKQIQGVFNDHSRTKTSILKEL